MCPKEDLSVGGEALTNSDSDVSMSESSDSNLEPETSNQPHEEASSDDEDEVIKAIRRECERTNDHPPQIICEDFITDLCFHPHHDLLAVASIVGDVVFYKYGNEENVLQSTLELHMKACRDIEFSLDGKLLLSTSKDKSIMISDFDSCKLLRFYENSHDSPVYCLTVIDENLFATGDEDGRVKLWDLREKGDKQIYQTRKNEDYISDIVCDSAHKYLLCSSGDGSLTTIDLQKRGIFMQSEELDDELTCLGLFRSETKLIAGSTQGKLFFFNWNEFGLNSDAFPSNKAAINTLIPITENIVVTACEDGNLRATHLFPHRHLGIVGQHDMGVECLDICNNGTFIASSGHNNEIKFWNIQYFETFEKVSSKHKKHERKSELANNLPSSKVRNNADFFSDLA
ncbi:WD repeat-containing protein 55 homolog [Euwallacea fornicatus]|uniref:WD repeat-containing protein 55 homolog n=1 Tax=Euwallacea fornicatus TaxID=995702 RepID=UPI00338F1898